MSIMNCESCSAQVDTDFDEMVTVKGKEVCENCVPDED